MPLLKNHSRLYSSKVPRTVLCSYGTGEELSCPPSQEKKKQKNKNKSWHEQSLMTSLQSRNGSSVRTAWFQVSFIFKYLNNKNKTKQKKRATGRGSCLLHFSCLDAAAAATSGDGRQEFSCRSLKQGFLKKQNKRLLCSELPTPASGTSRDPAVGMISIWTDFQM